MNLHKHKYLCKKSSCRRLFDAIIHINFNASMQIYIYKSIQFVIFIYVIIHRVLCIMIHRNRSMFRRFKQKPKYVTIFSFTKSLLKNYPQLYEHSTLTEKVGQNSNILISWYYLSITELEFFHSHIIVNIF